MNQTCKHMRERNGEQQRREWREKSKNRKGTHGKKILGRESMGNLGES